MRLPTGMLPPSPIVPAAVPVNENVADEPSGIVCFSTMSRARCLLLNVQVTVSPAWRLIALTGLLSSHVADVRPQPAFALPETEKAPGVRGPLSFVWVSDRLKFVAE